MKEPCCSMHRGVDLWTVISKSAEIAKIWLRSGNEPNSDAYETSASRLVAGIRTPSTP